VTPDQVTGRLAVAQLELVAKGHSGRDAQTATWRAVRYAQRMSEQVRPAVRSVVFADFLEHQLRGCDAWLDGVEEARARGDYAAGMERAARDQRYEDGMQRLTGTRPQQTAQAWRAAAPQAVEAWESPR
jgi:hypothetical protein